MLCHKRVPTLGNDAGPTTGVGYAYVTSQMGTRPTGDLRAIRNALYSAMQYPAAA